MSKDRITQKQVDEAKLCLKTHAIRTKVLLESSRQATLRIYKKYYSEIHKQVKSQQEQPQESEQHKCQKAYKVVGLVPASIWFYPKKVDNLLTKSSIFHVLYINEQYQHYLVAYKKCRCLDLILELNHNRYFNKIPR